MMMTFTILFVMTTNTIIDVIEMTIMCGTCSN